MPAKFLSDWTPDSMKFRFEGVRGRDDDRYWLFPVHASHGQSVLPVVSGAHRSSVSFHEL